MSQVELYEFRKHNLEHLKDSFYYKWVLIYKNDHPKAEGRYSFVEWISADFYAEQSDYFNQIQLSMLKRDLQSKYRQILDKYIIEDIERSVLVNTVKDALLNENESFKWEMTTS